MDVSGNEIGLISLHKSRYFLGAVTGLEIFDAIGFEKPIFEFFTLAELLYLREMSKTFSY